MTLMHGENLLKKQTNTKLFNCNLGSKNLSMHLHHHRTNSRQSCSVRPKFRRRPPLCPACCLAGWWLAGSISSAGCTALTLLSYTYSKKGWLKLGRFISRQFFSIIFIYSLSPPNNFIIALLNREWFNIVKKTGGLIKEAQIRSFFSSRKLSMIIKLSINNLILHG